MAVSVITPAYRAEATIARAVQSVLKQTAQDWEMILVADDGTDYAALLKAQKIRDGRLRFASTGQVAAGPGTARNAGLKAAKHPIVAYLDADDAYAENYLAAMEPLARAHGAATSAVRLIGVDGKEEVPKSLPPEEGPLTLPDLLFNGLCYANIAVDRRHAARWPEGIRYGEDQLYWTQLLDALPSIHYTGKTEYRYFAQAGSLSWPKENTRELCIQREQMIAWLKRHPLKHADVMIRWLSLSNDAEAMFGFKRVSPERYAEEFTRRMKML